MFLLQTDIYHFTHMLKHHSAPLPPAEQRQVLAADERKREFHEEKRNEFESFAEEEHDGTET